VHWWRLQRVYGVVSVNLCGEQLKSVRSSTDDNGSAEGDTTAPTQPNKPLGGRNNPMKKNDEGFTLIELLIVIVILGILATVVVFAVGGITDRGEESSCEADLATLEVATEAFFAQEGTYPTSDAQLVTADFLRDESELYEVAADGSGDIGITNMDQCGSVTP
jgi:prepilin-type N-terminal cleavage/methylation domain-containing protein